MFPLYDDNPVRRPPVVVWALIAVCVLVFLWQVSLGEQEGQYAIYALGMTPAVLFGHAELSRELQLVPAWVTPFTSMFLHGGWLHLGGNMLYLWIFGNNVEDSMSRPRFLVFYLLCGVAAALAQGLVNTSSEIPIVGASGAIAGVLGAYLVLYPRARILSLVFLGWFIRLVELPAMLVLTLWFVLQLAQGFVSLATPGVQTVAFWAHVGGFVAGLLLIRLFVARTPSPLSRLLL